MLTRSLRPFAYIATCIAACVGAGGFQLAQAANPLLPLIANTFTDTTPSTLEHTTWISSDALSETSIAIWNRELAARAAAHEQVEILVQLDWAGPIDLGLLQRLPQDVKLRVLTRAYPIEPEVAAWRSLTSGREVELIVFDNTLPTPVEIEVLNRLGVDRVLWVLSSYPEEEEATRLSQVQLPMSITFDAHNYPMYVEIPGIAAIPAQVPLLWIADYWPWYSDMDAMNFLPHSKKIRVKGMYLPEEAAQYLHALRALEKVEIEIDAEPSGEEWSKFGNIPLNWIFQGRVPELDALRSYEVLERTVPGSRTLTIDSSDPLAPTEKNRARSVGLKIHWIEDAPRW